MNIQTLLVASLVTLIYAQSVSITAMNCINVKLAINLFVHAVTQQQIHAWFAKSTLFASFVLNIAVMVKNKINLVDLFRSIVIIKIEASSSRTVEKGLIVVLFPWGRWADKFPGA